MIYRSMAIVFAGAFIGLLQNTLLQALEYYFIRCGIAASLSERYSSATTSHYSMNFLMVEMVAVWPVQILCAFAVFGYVSKSEKVIPQTVLMLLSPVTMFVACVFWLLFEQPAPMIVYYGGILQFVETALGATIAGLLWVKVYPALYSK